MNDSVKRWFLIVIGTLGAISCGAVIILSLRSGLTLGPSLAWWVTDTNYSSAANSSQFGFMLFMNIVGLIGFGWRMALVPQLARAQQFVQADAQKSRAPLKNSSVSRHTSTEVVV